MKIKNFDKSMINEVINLWNNNKDDLYIKYNEETFVNNFINNQYFKDEASKVIIIDNKIIGFGNAVFTDSDENSPAFITCIVIDKAYRRKGYGSKLLNTLEFYLKDNKKIVVRQIFFNPIKLAWIIPGTNNHYHPGTPAVPFNTSWYFFLKANGYIINGDQQDAYYQNIEAFNLPERIKVRNAENTKKGYNITFYDESKHFGFDELFSALKNQGWQNAVNNNLNKQTPLPMLIVEKEGEILGWTGPLMTEESKRGYFAGIGVHPKAQGLGLGHSLFNELIVQSKINGAEYMSLFTGSSNPARNIYLKAGFKIVQSFAILRKEL